MVTIKEFGGPWPAKLLPVKLGTLKKGVTVCMLKSGTAPPPSGAPNKDKQLVFISGLAHNSTLGINRHQVWHAMRAFLTMPENRALGG